MTPPHFKTPPTLVAWSFNFDLVTWRKMAEIENSTAFPQKSQITVEVA
jgi:hypothetical protein